MKNLFILLFALMAINVAAQQATVMEKDHAISRKSRKGFLGAVTANEADGTFDMVFVLKPTSRKIPYEIYTFDKELNLINTKKEEDEVEKMRLRFKWFKFKGETYESKSAYARGNLKGELVLREKLIRYKWSWLLGGYSRKVTTGAKIKPKNDAGDNYLYFGGFYDRDEDGFVLIPVFEKGSDNAKAHIAKVDGDANMTMVQDFTLPQGRKLVFSQPLGGELNNANSADRDWILLFAADKSGSKEAYTFIRLNADGKIIEQKEIEVKNAPWRIIDAIQKDGQVYFYGPSIDKNKYSADVLGQMVATTTSEDAADDKGGNVGSTSKALFGSAAGAFGSMKAAATGEMFVVTQGDIDKRLDELKYSNFQVAKLNNGQLDFLSNPSVKDINNSNVKPPSQKKEVEFDGKRFITTNAKVSSSNNLFIGGQDFKLDQLGKNKGTPLYKGMFLLQFDNQGKFLRNFGVELERKKYLGQFSRGLTPDMYPASSMFIESKDKKTLYWMIGECKAIDTDTDIETDYNYATNTQTTTITTSQGGLYTVQYGAIDIASGTCSEFKVLGDDEKRNYYLFPSNNSVSLNEFTIFISETSRGDKILLSRFDLSK